MDLVKYCRHFVIFFFSLLFSAQPLYASPWIGTTEPLLYRDLQTLVEQGYLDVALSSFPVPWKGIDTQLSSLDMDQLSSEAQVAVRRLQHYFSQQQKNQTQRFLKLYAANDRSRFTDFAGEKGSKAAFSVISDTTMGRWAAKLAVNLEPGGEKNLDQSFLAYQFGDWNLRFGAIDQWWGPGNASSLILSTNARPVTSIALSRSQATVSENSWLSFLGPWYFTAQIGQTGDDRVVNNTRLWASRFNFQPLSGLEIGLSWTAMWGGDGQGNSFSDLFKVLTFRAECANNASQCDDSLDTKAGNQLAGYDIRYSFQLLNQPFSLYAQQIGEDAVDYYKITDKALLIGMSTHLWGNRVFLENADTNVVCGGSESTITNCYYEHSLYQSGYRHYGRAIGSTFDSDANVTSIGISQHFPEGGAYAVTAHYADLNKDGVRPSPLLAGQQEKLIQLNGYYQFPINNWLIKVGTTITGSEIDLQPRKWDSVFYAQFDYYL
ncbi:capsule assembly Wzi family protein [Neptunicella sp. SCSIO 80796]|uniref:capsule assembly Wzi family protein n=1 Tax=Neptunicella plasticusilytica TaxID=3117012 RepID=UPI003A4D4A23